MNTRACWAILCASLLVWLAGCKSTTPEPAPSGGLASLPLLDGARTRSISAENLTGAKGQGGMAVPHPGEAKPAASACLRPIRSAQAPAGAAARA